MCQVEERVNIRPDGSRQIFENTVPCSEAQGGTLCSNVKRRTQEYYPRKSPSIARGNVYSPARNKPVTFHRDGAYHTERRRSSNTGRRRHLRPYSTDWVAEPEIVINGNGGTKSRRYPSRPGKPKNLRRPPFHAPSWGSQDEVNRSLGSDTIQPERLGFPQSSLSRDEPFELGHVGNTTEESAPQIHRRRGSLHNNPFKRPFIERHHTDDQDSPFDDRHAIPENDSFRPREEFSNDRNTRAQDHRRRTSPFSYNTTPSLPPLRNTAPGTESTSSRPTLQYPPTVIHNHSSDDNLSSPAASRATTPFTSVTGQHGKNLQSPPKVIVSQSGFSPSNRSHFINHASSINTKSRRHTTVSDGEFSPDSYYAADIAAQEKELAALRIRERDSLVQARIEERVARLMQTTCSRKQVLQQRKQEKRILEVKGGVEEQNRPPLSESANFFDGMTEKKGETLGTTMPPRHAARGIDGYAVPSGPSRDFYNDTTRSVPEIPRPNTTEMTYATDAASPTTPLINNASSLMSTAAKVVRKTLEKTAEVASSGSSDTQYRTTLGLGLAATSLGSASLGVSLVNARNGTRANKISNDNYQLAKDNLQLAKDKFEFDKKEAALKKKSDDGDDDDSEDSSNGAISGNGTKKPSSRDGKRTSGVFEFQHHTAKQKGAASNHAKPSAQIAPGVTSLDAHGDGIALTTQDQAKLWASVADFERMLEARESNHTQSLGTPPYASARTLQEGQQPTHQTNSRLSTALLPPSVGSVSSRLRCENQLDGRLHQVVHRFSQLKENFDEAPSEAVQSNKHEEGRGKNRSCKSSDSVAKETTVSAQVRRASTGESQEQRTGEFEGRPGGLNQKKLNHKATCKGDNSNLEDVFDSNLEAPGSEHMARDSIELLALVRLSEEGTCSSATGSARTT